MSAPKQATIHHADRAAHGPAAAPSIPSILSILSISYPQIAATGALGPRAKNHSRPSAAHGARITLSMRRVPAMRTATRATTGLSTAATGASVSGSAIAT